MLASPRWAIRLSRLHKHSARFISSRPVSRRRNTIPKPPLPSRRPPRQDRPSEPRNDGESKLVATSNALQQFSHSEDNNLLTPVHIPEDPNGVLRETHPAVSILANSSVVVQRQLEMMNVLLGFEQANRYVIMDPQGNHIGFLAEQEHGLGSAVARQAFRTHRSFTTHVFDKNEKEVLRFHRPFSWISSRIRVYDAINQDADAVPSTSSALQGFSAGSLVRQTSASVSPLHVNQMRIIGEAQQQWAPLRRKYNLFLFRDLRKMEANQEHPQISSGELPLSTSTALQVADQDRREGSFVQFAYVNEPFLAWDFTLLSSDNRLIGSVNRNFAGFAREIFTDTGVYALRMDAAGLAAEPSHLISRTGRDVEKALPGMTLDQRAVMLATAVSIDFDYFSRHSHAGAGGFFPFPIFWGGGGEAAGAGAAGAAGEAGAVGAAGEAGSAVGTAARGAGSVGMSEGAIAGAGTMAGYEAMQRTRERQSEQAHDDASPVATDPGRDSAQQQDVWGDDWPSSGGQGGGPPSSGDGGFGSGSGFGSGGGGGDGGGGGGGGGGGFDWNDWF